MHAHDRTLLAKLGFADPDKQDSRHDLGCQYLTTPEVIEKLVGYVAGPLLYDKEFTSDLKTLKQAQADKLRMEGGVFRGRKSTSIDSIGSPYLEFPLSKGDGQYKTTIGFLDVVIPYQVREERHGEKGLPRECADHSGMNSRYWYELEWSPASNPPLDDRRIVVEVKVSPLGLGDILRQMNTYKEFSFCLGSRGVARAVDWVLATLFPLSDSEIAILKREDIHHVRLGSAFVHWAEWQQRPNSNAESTVSITL